MRRNRFVKRKKRRIEGKWIFLIISVLIITVSFMYAQARDSKTMVHAQEEESTSDEFNYEESELSQIGGMEKKSAQVECYGMSARIACLDIQYEEQDEEQSSNVSGFSEKEISLLQKIVFAEAGQGSEKLQKGVTSVILNRMKSNRYPDTVEDVIFQENQFSPTEGDKIFFWDWVDNETCYYREVLETDITEEVKKSVNSAIMGDNPIANMTGFYATQWISDEELAKREHFKDVIIIDEVVFHGDWTTSE